MEVRGQAGPRTMTDGAQAPLRQDREGAIVSNHSHGRFAEATRRGQVYSAATTTPVGVGAAPGVNPPIALWNPPDSGVDLHVLRAGIGYGSGTLGAGHYGYTYIQQTAAPTGTALQTRARRLKATSVTAPGNKGVCYTATTGVTATPVALEAVWTVGAEAAATALGPALTMDTVDGSIIVPPGFVLCIDAIAAAVGTSPTINASLCWEEVPNA